MDACVISNQRAFSFTLYTIHHIVIYAICYMPYTTDKYVLHTSRASSFTRASVVNWAAHASCECACVRVSAHVVSTDTVESTVIKIINEDPSIREAIACSACICCRPADLCQDG